MKRAIANSRTAGVEKRTGGAFGAVIVNRNGQVIADGTNQVVANNDPTWYGEMHAIRNACAALKRSSSMAVSSTRRQSLARCAWRPATGRASTASSVVPRSQTQRNTVVLTIRSSTSNSPSRQVYAPSPRRSCSATTPSRFGKSTRRCRTMCRTEHVGSFPADRHQPVCRLPAGPGREAPARGGVSGNGLGAGVGLSDERPKSCLFIRTHCERVCSRSPIGAAPSHVFRSCGRHRAYKMF
jgi:tRNA(Arg) A34 adenosine deaminase TadA